MPATLFGLEIYTRGAERLLEDLQQKSGKIHIISGNAEVLKAPLSDKNVFRRFAGPGNIIIPDGISVLYPIRRKDKTARKIPGVEFMQTLLENFQGTDKSAYFLGAKDAVLQALIPRLRERYPGLNIAGWHHGYFDRCDCAGVVAGVIADIQRTRPYALFVALGTPAQEEFIFEHMAELPCTLFMGVGGSFDVASGMVKRSPRVFRALGLEWLYRIAADPSKIRRVWNNAAFTITAFLRG